MEYLTKGTKEDFRLTHTERGIMYFEGGWWAHESDWKEAWDNKIPERGWHTTLKPNTETKQIELDRFFLPH